MHRRIRPHDARQAPARLAVYRAGQTADAFKVVAGILDKVKSFMGGAQRSIYDEARNTLAERQANIEYVDPEAGQKIRDVLADPACHQGNTIQDLKSALYDLKEKVELKVLEERNAVIAAVDEVADKVTRMPEFQGLDAVKQARITERLDRQKSGLASVTMIPVLQNKAHHARGSLLAELIAEVDRLARPPQDPFKPPPGVNDPPAPALQAPTYINAAQIKVPFPKAYLSDDADVAEYIDELKKTLLVQIHAGKKVIV